MKEMEKFISNEEENLCKGLNNVILNDPIKIFKSFLFRWAGGVPITVNYKFLPPPW